MLAEVLAAADDIKAAYDALETNKCMRRIMECADLANKYIDEKAPWALVKDDPEAARKVCSVALNALRILSIYLSPVLPTITAKLFAFLNLQQQQWADLNSHVTHSSVQPYQHVLKRLTLEDVEKLILANA